MLKNRKNSRLVLIYLCLFCLIFLSACKKKEDNTVVSTSNTKTKTVSTTTTQNSTNEKVDEQSQNENNKDETDGGGNEYNSESANSIVEIDILVSQDEYIYKNQPISLDAFIKEINDAKDNVIVNISDNEATRKAYSKLVDRLNELNISYTEN